METRVYKASKTRSNRPGWSVTFSHPCRSDARGKLGLKVRRGLGTTDDVKADQLVEQINALLTDESWWSLDKRTEAERRFDKVAASIFFDGMERGKIKAKDLRDKIISLPTPNEGYARILIVGATGAGKTTLLRHLIGSDHQRDRFPSTSTAKTTTADIEVVVSDNCFYEGVVTFMREHEVRCAVDECLEVACESVIRGHDDTGIAEALLEHPEQRFRLSYPLGAWQREQTSQEMDDLFDDYMDEATEADNLSDDETVPPSEAAQNNSRLEEYVSRIRKTALAVHEQMMSEHGDFQSMDNANERQAWLENFNDALYENQGFTQISLDIMDAIQERFALITAGEFERSSSGWPVFWNYREIDRDAFLKQMRWFSANHWKQFGRLLTPIVDGIRVSGPFQPTAIELQNNERKLVLMDGEGLGHSAKEATSISTKVTEKFSDADMILLVDNAEAPMLATPLEFLRLVGTSGYGHKIGVAFTHFDNVKGDNLGNYAQKKSHVRASVGNAIVSLRESLGAPVTEILDAQLRSNDFYLSSLNRPTGDIPRGFIRNMKDLLERMQQSAEPSEKIDLAPIYNIARLELNLRDAADGFKEPWLGRLGVRYYEGIRKEHWARVKALCRRIANLWDDEYNGLRPVSDMIRELQASISMWLDNPEGWTRLPADANEAQSVINEIRQTVFSNIHTLAQRRLIHSRLPNWETAYWFSGRGSSYKRADEMVDIYDAAAPSITSTYTPHQQEFLNEVIGIISDAVKNEGGSIRGIANN